MEAPLGASPPNIANPSLVKPGTIAAMAHSKQVNRTIELSIHEVYEVVSGERFLLTDEGMVEKSDSQIVEAKRKELPDGRVWARVGVRASQKELEELSEDRTKPLAFQETYVSQPDEEGAFEATSTMELPMGMGTMETRFIYAAADSDLTTVEAILTAKASIPLISGKLEKHLLKTSDKIVDDSLARIRNLSGTEAQ